MSTLKQFFTLILLLSISLMFLGCNKNDDGRTLRLNTNLQKWNTQGISDYQVTTQSLCFCINDGPVVMQVEQKQVKTAFFESSGVYLNQEELLQLRTIEQHFDIARHAINNADKVTVKYHPIYGFPTSINIDYHLEVADDEIEHILRDFQ